MVSAAGLQEYCRPGALGRGLRGEPFNPLLLAPVLLWGCHCGGPGESFWLLDSGCCAPFLSALSWLRLAKGLWWPAALQSAWNWGLGCGRDRVTGCKQLKVLQILLKTLPLSRDLREGEKEKPRSTHVTWFLCWYSWVGPFLGLGILNQSRVPLLDCVPSP